MNHAKKLLMQDANVTEACYEVGFESLSYFNKIFKKITGENPSTFRKRKGLD
ncbi:MAG: helix-turn-helix domain-containing protein [Sediminibacterium sp.]